MMKAPKTPLPQRLPLVDRRIDDGSIHWLTTTDLQTVETDCIGEVQAPSNVEEDHMHAA